ncbi:MAG: peptidoglycan-binding protein [Candidatus Staskawiczbacteria bacterium]|nr:peptidoglycan-binding protein [Candidatus Staskawiczbacteria bacterium]
MWFKNLIKYLMGKVEETPIPDGFISSPPDFRDVKASDILGDVSTAENPTPDNVSCPYVLTQKNQGLLPICVGESGATINEYEKRRQEIAVEFDGQWLYDECKKIDGLPAGTQGTYFRAVLSVLKNKGAKPVGGKEEDAGNYKIAGYVQVEPNFDAIKRAIWKWGTVLMGFRVYTGGSWNASPIKIPSGSKVSGGHATVGKAFTKEFIRGQNSFGAGWGSNGDFDFGSEFLPYECWAVVQDIPTTLLPDQNNKPKHTFTVNLLPGYNSDEVKILQDCLKWLGCMAKTQASTGLYGQITIDAVKNFQGRYGITTTGNVGPLTILQLNKLFQ